MANLQYFSKETKKFYLMYLIVLIATLIILIFTKPAFFITGTILVLFFLLDTYLLVKTGKKVTKVILGELVLFIVWAFMLYPF